MAICYDFVETSLVTLRSVTCPCADFPRFMDRSAASLDKTLLKSKYHDAGYFNLRYIHIEIMAFTGDLILYEISIMIACPAPMHG